MGTKIRNYIFLISSDRLKTTIFPFFYPLLFQLRWDFQHRVFLKVQNLSGGGFQKSQEETTLNSRRAQTEKTKIFEAPQGSRRSDCRKAETSKAALTWETKPSSILLEVPTSSSNQLGRHQPCRTRPIKERGRCEQPSLSSALTKFPQSCACSAPVPRGNTPAS